MMSENISLPVIPTFDAGHRRTLRYIARESSISEQLQWFIILSIYRNDRGARFSKEDLAASISKQFNINFSEIDLTEIQKRTIAINGSQS